MKNFRIFVSLIIVLFINEIQAQDQPIVEDGTTEGLPVEDGTTEGLPVEDETTEGLPDEEQIIEDVDVPTTPRLGQFNMYFAYTRSNPRTPVLVASSSESIQQSPLANAVDTVIIVHGHEESATTSLSIPIKDAILTAQDYNVIVVDWSLFALQSYSTAVTAVPRIAEGVAEFIQLLVNENKVILSQLHLVGFDLGAHVVGIVGRNLNGEAARITGLDPSGSEWGVGTQRLTLTDAQYVEVIHTDGFTTRANGIGEAIGHVDFFSNNGRTNQPGCSNNACSHKRAWELFESSILNDNLIGYRCDEIADMTNNRCNGATLRLGGLDYVKYGTGIFRATTVQQFPYV